MIIPSSFGWRTSKMLFFLLFTSILTFLVECQGQYQTFYLEDSRVCPPFGGKKKIKMSSKQGTALLIRLTRYPTVADLLTGCHLEIDAPKGYGLQAVIEDINLRSHSVSGPCIDYVMFGRDDDGTLSKEICGQRSLVTKQALLSQNPPWDGFVDSLVSEGQQATTFYDPGGELHIWFLKNTEKMEPGARPLDLKIVVTAYKHMCKVNDTQLRSCSPLPSAYPKVQDNCIDSSLFCDGRINCGTGTYNDETNCKGNFFDRRADSTVTVAIFIVVGILLLCLLSAIYCFWRRRRARLQRSPGSHEEQQLQTYETSNSERPPLIVSIPLRQWEDPVSDQEGRGKKETDLPPSYDELFPQAGSTHSDKPN